MNRSQLLQGLLYGTGIALGASVLRWVEYQYVLRVFTAEIYITLIAIAFMLFGLWLGRRLTTGSNSVSSSGVFVKNTQALAYLGISEREYDVLLLLAEGHSNREIAKKLFVSPNTVKTHLARIYEKLEVTRRTQAVGKAKELRLVP